MQTIAVILILACAIGYTVWWIWQKFQKAKDPCEGCDGCQLKELKQQAKECTKRKNTTTREKK